MKKRIFAVLATLSFILSAGSASAHVRLDPSTAVVGRQTYYVRVPNEKDIPTVNVRLVVPANVEVTGVLSAPGWTHSEKTEAIEHDGEQAETGGHGDEAATRITEITWSGGQISKGEYMLFGIATNYTGSPAELTWKAYQTYSDGTIVPWDDSSDEGPAPKVSITAESALNALEGKVDEIALKQSDSEGFKADANTYLAGAALLIAIASLGLTLRKAGTAPASNS